MINEQLLGENVPRGAKMINQLTSNQAVRAFMAVALIVALVYQIMRGGEISSIVLSLLSTMLGYYFGENAPMPPRADREA